MNCRKVCRLLSAYMDGELPGVEHRQIFEHLAHCAECERDYRDLLQMKRMLAGMQMKAPFKQMPDRILRHIAMEESRRPLHWSQRLLGQFEDWWQVEAGSPRTLAALGGVLLVIAIAPRLPIAHRTSSANRFGIQWTAVNNEVDHLPTVPQGPDVLNVYTNNLRSYPDPKVEQAARWTVAPWDTQKASSLPSVLFRMPGFNHQPGSSH